MFFTKLDSSNLVNNIMINIIKKPTQDVALITKIINKSKDVTSLTPFMKETLSGSNKHTPTRYNSVVITCKTFCLFKWGY